MQIADLYLKPIENQYIGCKGCPPTSYLSSVSRKGKKESRCIECDTRFYQCLNCGTDGT